MNEVTRRDFLRASAIGGAGFSIERTLHGHDKINSRVKGVVLGAQSYSFRDRGVYQVVEGMSELGIGLVELWQGSYRGRAWKK